MLQNDFEFEKFKFMTPNEHINNILVKIYLIYFYYHINSINKNNYIKCILKSRLNLHI